MNSGSILRKINTADRSTRPASFDIKLVFLESFSFSLSFQSADNYRFNVMKNELMIKCCHDCTANEITIMRVC